MSGGRKTVQGGVRVRLGQGMTWDRLAAMTPEEIRNQGAFPAGFLRLPHVKQSSGGQVFPKEQIDEINAQEKRSLELLDVDFGVSRVAGKAAHDGRRSASPGSGGVPLTPLTAPRL